MFNEESPRIMNAISSLTIEGYKSIRRLENFKLRSLNVLIGANGAGKSNFVSFFRFLHELIEQRLNRMVAIEGGADAFLHLGPKVTPKIVVKLRFGSNGYEFTLEPTVTGEFQFAEEKVLFLGGSYTNPYSESFGSGHRESKLKDHKDDPGIWGGHGVPHYVYETISSWTVYHFHDTSLTASVRRPGPIHLNEKLLPNAENLAAFLYRLQKTNPDCYGKIRDVLRLAAPFFDDFNLRPMPTNPDLIQLEWRQKDSEHPFLASQLSDGTLRFICLATALLQPLKPATMIFDEPELGLHPYALTLAASLFKQAVSTTFKKQIILSTQSVPLLNEFAPEDVIVVERYQGESVFRQLDSAQLSDWIKEYSLGELWQKNVLGGQPQSDQAPLPSAVIGESDSGDSRS